MAEFVFKTPEEIKKLTPTQVMAYCTEVATHAKKSDDEKAALIKLQQGPMRIKVGEKGGVSVYGLGRFPVTLYKEQWRRLLAYFGFFAADEQIADYTGDSPILVFLRDNDAQLKTKAESEVEKANTPTAGIS